MPAEPTGSATLSKEMILQIVEGRCSSPDKILGIHPLGTDGDEGQVVRAFFPLAKEVAVVTRGRRTEMRRIHEGGLFEACFPGAKKPFRYRFAVKPLRGDGYRAADPYSLPPHFTEFDSHLFGEGSHVALYGKLGAHVTVREGIRGVSFALWAPNACHVSVVGNFNDWDRRIHPMIPRPHGIWELFIPEIGVGELYKYHIRSHSSGEVGTKADPFGFAMEVRPDTASIVSRLGQYRWKDSSWMANRRSRQSAGQPISIYEVHLGSWRRHKEGNRWLTYDELARTLIPYVKEMGFTHIQLMPITEHPFDGSWGYQTVGYFAPTSRFGSPDDFRRFIDTAHGAGIGVILDWVPAHFPKDGHGLAYFDGTHLFEHADPRQGHHPDWDTFIYNYGRNEVAAFLISSAHYWIDEFHLDGLRVDAVASMLYLDYSRQEGQWVPNRFGGRENLEAVAFLERFNREIHRHHPGVLTIAEESTSWPKVTAPVDEQGLGFDYKWNMGWMNDTLEYMKLDPVHRAFHHDKITFSMIYAFDERFMLPLSHDEVVHGKQSLLFKMPGDSTQMIAGLRLLLGFMYGQPGKKLLFMGSEFGQRREWNHDAELEWDLLSDKRHVGIRDFVRELNALYRRKSALHEREHQADHFQWIDCNDRNRSLFSWIRRGKRRSDSIVVVANFTPVRWRKHIQGMPQPGKYKVLLSSDAKRFGGSGARLTNRLATKPVECHGLEHSLELDVPPLSIIFLERRS